MTIKYEKNYLKEVILRIDFPSTPLDVTKFKSKDLVKKIYPYFSKLEQREILDGQKTIVEWRYYDKDQKNFITLSNESIFFRYSHWTNESFCQLEQVFLNILDVYTDLAITRFGLRYVNHVEIDEDNPTDWTDYLNENLLSIFDIAEDRGLIIRAFHNLELRYDDDMRLRFQYGMHNPDYPAIIRKKLFVLDYDAYHEGLLERDELKDKLSVFHTRILSLFKKSIKEKLNEKMGVMLDEL